MYRCTLVVDVDQYIYIVYMFRCSCRCGWVEQIQYIEIYKWSVVNTITLNKDILNWNVIYSSKHLDANTDV